MEKKSESEFGVARRRLIERDTRRFSADSPMIDWQLRSGRLFDSCSLYLSICVSWFCSELYSCEQGWGGPAVQYRQYTPVPANFGLVSDWRSNLGCSVLDWECQSLHLGNDPVHPDCRSFYFLARYFAYLTNKVALRAKI